MMTKVVQITDLHLVPSGRILRGVDPEQRLRSCLRDIERFHQDATALVITGDLVDEAEPDVYDLLHGILADYRLPPVHLTVGNHDDRRAFARVFPGDVVSDTGFANKAVALGNYLGILIDTWEFGTHAGALCADRLSWLTATLAADDRPVVLFMHHVPFNVGLKWLDRLPMKNDVDLARALEPFRSRIRHLFFGHLHRNVSGTWMGYPFTVSASAAVHHGTLDFQSEISRPMIVDPFYTVILLGDDQVVVHANQVIANPVLVDYGPSPPPRHTA
ncbi:3',5'-cyclic adenosine monophosphate phosphodiesterase CpdA [Chelatococcus asaccharovorans]|nr:3',5'-cyclic adenosine monophosphate phosphodiesterase CpdA [Chelatococcus asaccharovorans]CAH1674937.1 3',5'-cyclic adenosine monophosphate phosphodiesterase CpdA [Chelatococcus asaccharovorans]